MKNKVLMGLAAIAMVAVLSSCGKVPQAEIDAANAAIAAAQTAEANVYVPTEFAAVQDSMNAINAAVEAQKGKLFKKFGPIKEKLTATVTLANKVAADAATKKEEVKAEVTSLMASIKTVLDENKTLITKAPRGKEGAAVLEQIKSERKSELFNFCFDFGYFNSSSGKLILDICKILARLHGRGMNVKVNWHYETGDLDMYEVGQEISRIVKLQFDFTEIEQRQATI